MPANVKFILNVISAFLLIFFSLFVISRRGQNRFSNLLLSGFLFLQAAPPLLNIIFYLEIPIFAESPALFLAIFNLDFLMGPFIFFYTRSLTERDFSFKKADWVHMAPIVTFNIYVVLTVLTRHFGNTSRSFVRGEIAAALIISHVILVFYAFKSVFVLKKFTASIKNIYSSIEKINLSWLRFVLIGYGIIWLMIISSSLWRILGGNRIPVINDFIAAGSFLVSIAIIYFGLTQPMLFSRGEERPKYLKSSLTATDSRVYTKKLMTYMETEKPYLTPSITINHLSEELGIHPKHISQLINENFNQNFFDFINSYRVEEAKMYLSKGDRSNLNILQILYEVGFNSKAAFNRSFKKYVGMTPREFKNHSEQSA